MSSTSIAEPQLELKVRHFETDHLLGDLHLKSVRGGVITLAAQAIKILLQMTSTMVLARLLTPKDFGLVAMVITITGFVAMFKDCGLSMATVQHAQITHAQVSTLFWINCALSAAVMLVVAMLAPMVAWFYHEPRLIWITLVLSITFVFSGLTVQHQALLRRQMQFKTLAIIDIVSMASGLAAGIGMAWGAGFGYWSLVGMTFATTLVNAILVWIKCDWRPGPYGRNVGARSMLAFGGSLTGFDVLNYFTRNFDSVLIGRVLGPIATGVYSKAYSLLALPMNQINAPISSVMLPALSRLQNEPEAYAKLYLGALKALSFVTVPMVVFSFVLAKDIILILLGAQWLSAVVVFQLLAPAALVSAINIAPGWLCISLGHPQKQLHYGLVSAPICVGAFLIGIKWGVEGVAAAFSLTFFILFWAFVWYASKDSSVKFSAVFQAFLSVFLLSGMAGMIAWITRHQVLSHANRVLALIACLIVFISAYLMGALFFKQTRSLVFQVLGAIRRTGHFS